MEVVGSSGEVTPLPKEEAVAKCSPPPQKYERLLLAEEQKMVDIEKPHHHDVLCGRGYVAPFERSLFVVDFLSFHTSSSGQPS
jgi:hypothetical protein